MKRTGRRLTLSNDINSLTPPSSIAGQDFRLTTIFEDDRENYGWKIVDIKQLNPISDTYKDDSNWSLMSVRPDSFKNATVFGNWAVIRQPWDNSLIGNYDFRINSNYSLRTEHVATNHLALFYNDNKIPFYNITMEEYELTSSEEIMFKVKETSQSLNQIGE